MKKESERTDTEEVKPLGLSRWLCCGKQRKQKRLKAERPPGETDLGRLMTSMVLEQPQFEMWLEIQKCR